MIKKLLLVSAMTLIISILNLAQPAHAHFIVEDSSTGVKSLFHVTPDHDPIAGKESVISFDFSKTGLRAVDYSYVLSVKSTRDEAVTVPVTTASNVLLAGYTFPVRGFYEITLTTTHKDNGKVSTLQYGQRVSRGVISKHRETLGPIEIGVVAGVISIAVGAIIFCIISDSSKRKAKKK